METDVSTTPFRMKEKQYQLHKEQCMKYRRGKMRGWKLTDKPTDFSDVLDLRTSPCSTSYPCTAHHLQGLHVPVYTFDQHPGLLYVPRYLDAAEQLELARAALQEYHEAPATTNHTARYPALPGLWAAAQGGLHLSPHLAQRPPALPAPPACPCSPAPTSQGQQQQRREQGQQQHHEGMEDTARHDCQVSYAAPVEACQAPGCSSSACQAPGCCSSCTPASSTRAAAGGNALEGGGTWQQGGSGPSAQKLLSKLRWATLGPPYNWTTRQYEVDAPHRPLPPRLHLLAAHMATLLLHLGLPVMGQDPPCTPHPSPASPGPSTPKAYPPTPSHSATPSTLEVATPTTLPHTQPSQPQPQPCHQTAPPHPQQQPQHPPAGACPQDDLPGHTTPCSAPPPPAAAPPYRPDAAIVNYYREGDTLGGHRDDAERSLAPPLVSVSLGSSAVFLMGGDSKMVPPTPLMLHSGDIVVLSGPARRCFHGVPRVLAGSGGLPEELQAQRVEARYREVAQWLEGGRINISIRTVT